MASNSHSNSNHLCHSKHRFLTALTLLVYSVCYLTFDLYMNHSILQPCIDIHNLYLTSFILIATSVFVSLFIASTTTKPNKPITIAHILLSSLTMIGGLLYITLTLLQSAPHLHYSESNDHLYAYALLNISAAFFIVCNAILLALITVSQYHFSGAIWLLHALTLILTSTGMAFFWSAYYNDSILSLTQTIFGLVQTGWCIIFAVSLGTLIYKAFRSEHTALLRMFSVLLVIGGFLVFAGASAFSANVIFLKNDVKHPMEIGIEWSLSFCVFIACIGSSALFIQSTDANAEPMLFITRQKTLHRIQRSSIDDAFDIRLETQPRREPLWADV